MEMDIKTEEPKEIILNDNCRFSYTIKQVEINIILGAAVAVLDEYLFTKKGVTESYKLYRTKDGNWYDLEDNKSVSISDAKRELKIAFDTTYQ